MAYDRHVVAAGIEVGADAIITWNLGDFPTVVIAAYGIEVRTPNQLVCALLDASATEVLAASREFEEPAKVSSGVSRNAGVAGTQGKCRATAG